MNNMDFGLFQRIIKAWYDGALDAALDKIMNEAGADVEVTRKTVARLCGVEISPEAPLAEGIKTALMHYTQNHRVVAPARLCFGKCLGRNNGEPCRKACPFNAIIVDSASGALTIDEDRCTGCGLCVDACPDGVMADAVEVVPALRALTGGKPVIAAVAPAIAGQFGAGVTLDHVRSALKKMGFMDMVEVAFFADMLTLKEAVEFDHHVKSESDFLITSCCCPIWVGMLKKVYGELAPHVSPSVSPMIAAGRVLKKIHPGTDVVFIGPCIAKKAEAKDADIAGAIDYVWTFDELKAAFGALSIDPAACVPAPPFEYASRGGRLYARAGGVTEAVKDAVGALAPSKLKWFTAVQADGIPGCKELLEKARTGQVKATFIEGMGCVGGCVGGPRVLIPREQGRAATENTADSSRYHVATESEVMNQVLSLLGVETVDDYRDPEKIGILERKF